MVDPIINSHLIVGHFNIDVMSINSVDVITFYNCGIKLLDGLHIYDVLEDQHSNSNLLGVVHMGSVKNILDYHKLDGVLVVENKLCIHIDLYDYVYLGYLIGIANVHGKHYDMEN